VPFNSHGCEKMSKKSGELMGANIGLKKMSSGVPPY
jgi:hypothetical protein